MNAPESGPSAEKGLLTWRRALIAAHDARWEAETLADLQETARRIVRQTRTCKCPDEKHHNLMHDLAADLLRVFPSDKSAS